MQLTIKTQLFQKKTIIVIELSLSSDRFSFSAFFPRENNRPAAAMEGTAVLYFTNNSLNVVLEGNVAMALLWDSCSSLRKLFSNFLLLLCFRDFSANASPKKFVIRRYTLLAFSF